MPALPNSHEALLRNVDRLTGRLAVIGLSDHALLNVLPARGLAVTEHVGLFAQCQASSAWSVAYGYDDPALKAGVADTVVVFLPKSRSELSMRLALAHSLATEGGRLILVGEKKQGIAGAVKQLCGLFPQAEKVDSARHCQVWLADKLPVCEPFDYGKWMTWHRVAQGNVLLDVAQVPGVFSDSELDPGTAMLLDTFAQHYLPAGPVLDFACGAGVIGGWLQVWQRARELPVSEVDGVDVQAQAVLCAQATYERAGAQGRIWPSDGLSEVTRQYAAVVSNPPFHSGIRTDTSMTESFLQSVSRHLKPGGELRLVANRFLPYEALIRRHIGKVHVLAEDKRFVVWSAKKT